MGRYHHGCTYIKLVVFVPSAPLGYNFQCDVNQLKQSYGELKCFKHYEMLLDIQNMFKEPRGGLSGLAKVIYLNLKYFTP